MDKGKGDINPYKSDLSNPSNKNEAVGDHSSSFSASALSHSNEGEYTSTERPKSGGHGQDAIDYMEAKGIPYEINAEYNNGVRVGNLPTHKQSMFRGGNRHTWFPKSWSANKIKKAGEYVASKYKGSKADGARYSAIYDGVKVTIIFGSDGSVKTAFPSADQPGD